MSAERTFALDARFLRRHRAGAEIALLVGGSVTLRAAAPSRSRKGDRGSVAVFDVDGVLAQRAEMGMCGGYIDGYDALAARFAETLADPDVHAVVLRTDSPGGDVAGLEEGVRRMQEAAAATWKPVLAFVDELAASAAVWVLTGVAKDGIFGPPAARFGSIATAVVHVDASGEAEITGRRVTIVRGLPGKMRPSGVEPVDEIGMARMQKLADAGTARFISAVSKVRGIDPAVLREMNAEVFDMAAAKAHRLVDGIESLEATIARAAALARKRMIEAAPAGADDLAARLSANAAALAERARASGMTPAERARAEANVGPIAPPPTRPPPYDPAGLAERARASGMTLEQRRAAEANVERSLRRIS